MALLLLFIIVVGVIIINIIIFIIVTTTVKIIVVLLPLFLRDRVVYNGFWCVFSEERQEGSPAPWCRFTWPGQQWCPHIQVRHSLLREIRHCLRYVLLFVVQWVGHMAVSISTKRVEEVGRIIPQGGKSRCRLTDPECIFHAKAQFSV